MQPTAAPSMRSPARTAALVAIALLAFAAPLELALRLFPGAVPLGLLTEFEPSIRSSIARLRKLPRAEDTVLVPRDDGGPADRMWVYKPRVEVTQAFDEPGIVATVRTDGLGFCNPEPDAYEAERIDVAAVGDSFTWCTNVEPAEAWPAEVARRTHLRVYNFGMPGRGLHEYLQTLRQFGLPKKPRIVIFDVYEGNDLRDAIRFRQAVDDDGSREGRPCPFSWRRLCTSYEWLAQTALARHSYAFNLGLASVWHAASSWRKREIDFHYDITFSDGVTIAFNSRNGDLDEVNFARALARDEVRLGVLDEPLRRFVALARQHRFLPLVVYTPSAYTAYREMARFGDADIERSVHAYSDRQRKYFARTAAELGYDFIDLTPALVRAARELPSAERLYFYSNVHLTQKGHEVVADEIAREVERLLGGSEG